MTELVATVITVSDRCSRGEQEDRSGPLAADLLRQHGCAVTGVVLVPDGEETVRAAIRQALDQGARVVLTTGGTGLSPRDLTPEATAPLLATRLPGVEAAIAARGALSVPTAVLSRGLVGIVGRGPGACLVVNAPGSTGGVRDTVAVVGPLLRHVVEQLDGGDH